MHFVAFSLCVCSYFIVDCRRCYHTYPNHDREGKCVYRSETCTLAAIMAWLYRNPVFSYSLIRPKPTLPRASLMSLLPFWRPPCFSCTLSKVLCMYIAWKRSASFPTWCIRSCVIPNRDIGEILVRSGGGERCHGVC